VVLFFGYGYGVAMTTHLDPTDHAPQPPMILTPQGWHDYRLLDSGHGQKLEEVGGFRFIRPEPQAFWAPHLPAQDWAEPAGVFVSGSRDQDEGGKWELSPSLPSEWSIGFEDIRFLAMPTPFRHFGFFPEQSRHWQWCAEMIKARIKATGTPPLMLNLFGYTGVASLHAAKAGAEVTHVDSSKKAIAQGFANRDHANMTDAPIRYITEDARSFVAREKRRGRRYDGIILDPPKYGRGAKGEIWRLEDDLSDLLVSLKPLLSDQPLFMVLTSYAIRASFLSLHHLMADTLQDMGGLVTSGELAIAEDRPDGRRLGQAIFSRWQGNTAP